jgi:uncharacterized protein (DUF2384 family)
MAAIPAIAFDLSQPELVARELGEANARLARLEEAPPDVLGLVEDLARQVAETQAPELEAVDPYLWIDLQRAALVGLGAVHEQDPAARRRALRLALEHLRFALGRLAEAAPVAEDRPVAEVVRWLDEALPVSQRRKAELLGVAERTFQRWVAEKGATHPGPRDERRVRVLARVVNQLRHVLTGAGVVDWLEHPRPQLRGRRPADLLEDPAGVERLMGLVAAARGGAAS